MQRTWNAKWITPKKEDKFHPIFFKDFFIDDEIEKATLFITGVGLFEAYINGKKINTELFTPYTSDYENHIQYFEYDITDLVHYGPKSASNSIDVTLGNGWFKNEVENGDNTTNCFALIAEIVIECKNDENSDDDIVIDTISLDAPIDIADSKSSIYSIGTDESWHYYASDIEKSGIYEGEVINRLLWDRKENPEKIPEEIRLSQELIKSYSLPIVVKEQLNVKNIFTTPLGDTILDFGQSFSGFLQFNANFKKGVKVKLEFLDDLQDENSDTGLDKNINGCFTYISDGKPDFVMPHFTYYSGRYVRVTGWEGELKADYFTACVIYSDMEQTGYISSSEEKINMLFEKCILRQKSNSIDILTNCPQRDDRLSYTADAAIFAKTACYNMDCNDFFKKYLFDLRSVQNKLQGGIPTCFPEESKSLISGLSGDASTIIPSMLYYMYGDIKVLEENYNLMKDWINYIDKNDYKDKKHYLYDFGYQIGDSNIFNNYSDNDYLNDTDEYFVSSIYYYMSLCLLKETASTLGYIVDMFKYKQLADNVKEALLNEYFTPNGRLAIDTQTAYILSLKAGVYINKEKIINGFLQRLIKDGYRIKTGIAATQYILCVMAENNMEELAYKLLFSEEYPSLLYEDNNYFYSAVTEFLYEYVGGIKPAEPGFTKIMIKPMINRRLTSFNCKYKSIKGDIVSNWEIKENGELSFHFEIPKDTQADIYLPSYHINGEKVFDGISVKEGSYDYSYMPTRNYLFKFSQESTIGEYMNDAAARIIIEKKNPELFNRFENADNDILMQSLDYFKDTYSEEGFNESIDEIKEILDKLV